MDILDSPMASELSELASSEEWEKEESFVCNMLNGVLERIAKHFLLHTNSRTFRISHYDPTTILLQSSTAGRFSGAR